MIGIFYIEKIICENTNLTLSEFLFTINN